MMFTSWPNLAVSSFFFSPPHTWCTVRGDVNESRQNGQSLETWCWSGPAKVNLDLVIQSIFKELLQQDVLRNSQPPETPKDYAIFCSQAFTFCYTGWRIPTTQSKYQTPFAALAEVKGRIISRSNLLLIILFISVLLSSQTWLDRGIRQRCQAFLLYQYAVEHVNKRTIRNMKYDSPKLRSSEDQRLGNQLSWPSSQSLLFQLDFRKDNRGSWFLWRSVYAASVGIVRSIPDRWTSALTRIFTPPMPSRLISSSLLNLQSPIRAMYSRPVSYSL